MLPNLPGEATGTRKNRNPIIEACYTLGKDFQVDKNNILKVLWKLKMLLMIMNMITIE